MLSLGRAAARRTLIEGTHMREVLDRGALHGLFMEELRRHERGAEGEFVFEIEHCAEGLGECNWYPLATIELWRGDLMRNLAAFRDVRDRLAARYDVSPAAAAHPLEAPAPA
jgi:hypothetical protein